MNAEEKQALIEYCKLRIRVLQNYLHIEAEKSDSKVYEIALSALTAQPVKLPKIKHPAQFDYADEVALVLKSHGIEVQE